MPCKSFDGRALDLDGRRPHRAVLVDEAHVDALLVRPEAEKVTVVADVHVGPRPDERFQPRVRDAVAALEVQLRQRRAPLRLSNS